MSTYLSKVRFAGQPGLARGLLSIVVSLSTSACASLGTHVVDIDADAELRVRNAPTSPWSAIIGENVKSRDARSTALFPSTTFRSKLLDWRIGLSATSFGHYIKSNILGKLCLRFDEARISSNMYVGELPFKVTFAEHGSIQTPPDTTGLPPQMRPAFSSPPMCFSEGEKTRLGFVIPITKLFPSGKLFNLSWEGNSTVLLNRGIGNWVRLRVPIEYEGKQQELEITFILKDAAARLIYL